MVLIRFFFFLLTRQSNKKQLACCGFARSILLARLAFQAMFSLVRNASLRSGFASLVPFVSYLSVGLITGKIIGAAIDVHRALGPGLLETAYEACLIYVVEEQVILENKSVSGLTSIHEAQLLSYLKLSGCRIGLLINFNVKYLKQGIRRMKS